jgi:hypothetical protein
MPHVTHVARPSISGARWWAGMAPLLVLPALAAAQPAPAPPPAPPPAAVQTPPPATAAPDAAATAAQPAPAAAPPVQALSFTTPAGALLVSILPDKTADFESLMGLYRQALAAGADEGGAALSAGWTVYKAGEPAPGGANALYLVLVDPAVAGADYSWQAVLSRIVAAFPDKQQEVFEKGTSVHAGPMNKLTLTKVPAPQP